jgi:polar amino acid transport system substrate-binding protein
MNHFVTKIGALAVVVASIALPAFAQDLSQLDQIIARGKIVVATSFSTPPYGMTDAELKPVGFDIALANMIAKDLGVELELKDVASQARIPTLTAGEADIVISSFGITAERAKTVMYSNSIYVDTQTILSRKDVTFNSYEDLVGKNIGVTRGSTNDTLITDNALPGTNILRFEDAAGGNQALFSGQVDGLVSGTAAAFAIMSQTDEYHGNFAMRSSPMGIGVRQGEFELLQWLDTEIMLLWNSGQIQAAQKQFIGSVNENLPDYWF